MELDIVRTLTEKIKAGYPCLYLVTHEEERALTYIHEAAKATERKVYTWLLTQGMVSKTAKGSHKHADSEDPSQVLDQAIKIDQNGIVVLRHYHHFLEAPQVQAQIVDLMPKFKSSRRMIIILTPVQKIPPELEKLISLVEMPLPTLPELKGIVDNFTTNFDKPDDATLLRLAENARGLTRDEAENAIALSMIRPNLGKTKQDKLIIDPEVVMDEKCETVKKSGFLKYYKATESNLGDIGGLGFFKEWIMRMAEIYKRYDEAMAFKCDVPKGVAVLGVPGTGKSLGAHATAAAFGLPLIRVDMGSIFGGIVGQSEANARAVIKFLEAVAPCVGWLDEIEKGFAGAGGGGQLDSGVGARVFGTFLTWMQEKEAPVFIYATANNVKTMPPELLRKGRFDELFYVSLPNQKEREEIFKIHVTKRGRADKIGKTLDLAQLSEMTKGFSGAEIEAIVAESLREAFFVKKDLNMFDLQETISKIVPLEVLMKDEIQGLKEWADGRTRPANYPDQVVGSTERSVQV